MSAEAWPSDEHLIPAYEDMRHEPTPDCPCRPRYIGRNAVGKRLFEHSELVRPEYFN